jgi:GH18 family chitinase
MRFVSPPSLLVFCSVVVFQSVSAGLAMSVYPDKVAAAWFANWHENDYPAGKVPWGKYTHVIYSFAYAEHPALLGEDG